MPLYAPQDAATVLADFGGPVVVDGGPTTAGRLTARIVAEQHFGVELYAEEAVLAVVPGSLGSLETEQVLTVDGVRYRYRRRVEGPADVFERHIVAREVNA